MNVCCLKSNTLFILFVTDHHSAQFKRKLKRDSKMKEGWNADENVFVCSSRKGWMKTRNLIEFLQHVKFERGFSVVDAGGCFWTEQHLEFLKQRDVG